MSFFYRDARLFKAALNAYPPYWGTGISITEVSPNFRRMEVQMKKRFYNSNAFGTHFGGSLYSMCDPHFVLLLVSQLGHDYLIRDTAAHIEFIKPGRGTVAAVFAWNEQQIDEIREKAADGSRVQPERTTEVKDENGETIARVWKQLYVRRKRKKPD